MSLSLSKDYLDVVNDYYNSITGIYGNKCIIFMDGTDETIGDHPKSDIILIFNRKGEMLVSCERLMRKDYSFMEFLSLKLKYFLKYKKETNSNKCVTIHEDHIDIVEFKAWWWQWAENLL